MDYTKIAAGENAPDDINVIIEIPALTAAVKYEVDKDSGAIFVDRFMSVAMHYPANYGYVPHTLSEDGDPLDVVVVTPVPLISGSVINCRPVGLLDMVDEAGIDAKIIAVPNTKVAKAYEDIQEYSQLPKELLESILHFFRHYKDLEPNKWVEINGFTDANTAKQKILASIH